MKGERVAVKKEKGKTKITFNMKSQDNSQRVFIGY